MNTHDDDRIVKVAQGDLVQIEMYQGVLEEAGIEAKVVGNELDTGFGTALSGSVELWVNSDFEERASKLIRQAEEERK